MQINDQLVQLVKALEELRGALSERMKASDSAQERSKLFLQYRDVGNRIVMIDMILIDRSLRDIADEVAQVQKATDDIREAIADIEQLNAIIKAIRDVLGIVDSVIALAV